MFSKIILWLKNPARYTWVRSPFKLTIFVAILIVAGVGFYLFRHSIKADVINTDPKIVTFSAPLYTSGANDYIIKVKVNNVSNVISTIDSTWTFDPAVACVLYSGDSYYPIRATTNNKTSIPLTTIHRNQFIDSFNQKHAMESKSEAVTLNCINNSAVNTDIIWVRKEEGGHDFSGLSLDIRNSKDVSTFLFKPNESYIATSESGNGNICGFDADDVMSGNNFDRTEYGTMPADPGAISVAVYCRKLSEKYITFSTGVLLFVQPSTSKWHMDFTAPKEVKPNTGFQVQYAVYDGRGNLAKVGTTCTKSGDWKGQTPDGSGTSTIPGWASGTKTFTLSCSTPSRDPITPVSRTVTVVNRSLTYTVDGQNVADNSNYQPPVNSSVLLAWKYQGPATDTCTSKAINASTGQAVGTFNGPIAFSGQKSAGQSSQKISYSITCATEKKTINVLAQLPPPITPPVTPPTLSLTINPTDYSSISSLGVYQLFNNQFATNWKLTPTTTGTPCIGSGDISTWNIKRSSSGSQLLTNISGTKKITLQCGMVSKSLSVNYTPTVITNPFTFKVMGRSYKDFPNEYVIKGKNATIEWNYTGTASSCTLWTKNKDNPGTTQNPLGAKSVVAKSGNFSYVFNYDTETRTMQCGTSQGAVNIIGVNGNIYKIALGYITF